MNEVIWRPQEGPQTALLECPTFEVFYGGARGGGKCLPLDEPVLTPFGWRSMGELQINDQLANPDGTTSRIINLYRPGFAKVYRLTFSDGSSVRCDGGHIWIGHFQGHKIKREGLDNKLYTTDEIIRKFREDQLGRFHIPLTKPVNFQRPRINRYGDLRPVDPYLLGILIGDGNLTNGTVRYATEDPEIDEYCSQFGTVRDDGGPNRRLAFAAGLIPALKKIGVWGKRSEFKEIPESYLWASIEERWALLQGLMDTDGTIDERGQCYYSSSSLILAKQVQTLAWSLGFKASHWIKETTHLDNHNIYLQGPERHKLFRLAKKLERTTISQEGTWQRRLVRVEELGEMEVACFQVDHPNNLFLTKDFIVTHNTEASIGDWLQHSAQYGENAIGIFVRRKLTQLSEVIARTKTLFRKIGAQYNEQRKEWTMSNGARLKFVYLERDSDAEEYQGHSYTRVYIEEATNFPSESPIAKLRATLRSGSGVPVGMRLTGNPGGPGHHWVKARYIDPDPRGYRLIRETETIEIDGVRSEVALERVFIPSKLGDNALLMKNDPTYVLRLRQSGSEALVRAWLEGDWSIVDGAFFDCFDYSRHVLPFEWIRKIPKSAKRFRSFDWGSARPFCCGWYALSDGTWGLPDGALLKYREWYGAKGPNIGLKMSADEVARGIVLREAGEFIRWSDSVADPAIYIRDGGPSIGEVMAQHGCSWRRADNKRVPGWEMLRMRLVGDPDPMLYFLETCEDSVRTIPMLQHDENRAEDIDTDGEDHAGDETRYACMSRPWYPRSVPQRGSDWPKLPSQTTFNDLLAAMREKRRQEAEI